MKASSLQDSNDEVVLRDNPPSRIKADHKVKLSGNSRKRARVFLKVKEKTVQSRTNNPTQSPTNSGEIDQGGAADFIAPSTHDSLYCCRRHEGLSKEYQNSVDHLLKLVKRVDA